MACVAREPRRPPAGSSARRAAGVEAAAFEAADYPDRAARDEALGEWLDAHGVDLVVLAGFMELLSPAFVARFRERIVNVHPSLLPAFPGHRGPSSRRSSTGSGSPA